jgi:hypothetical protein
MTSFKQIEANRRNARRSTGPVTEDGKLQSRRNAVRHGLTAETVIGALEDAEDYKAFQAAVTADYDAQSAVERELVLRLASLLWRVRRATTTETGLFEIQAKHLLDSRSTPAQDSIHRLFGPTALSANDVGSTSEHMPTKMQGPAAGLKTDHSSTDLAQCFLRLASLPTFPLDRLSRYEATLWRQAGRTIFALEALHRRKPWERRSRVRPHRREWSIDTEDDN